MDLAPHFDADQQRRVFVERYDAQSLAKLAARFQGEARREAIRRGLESASGIGDQWALMTLLSLAEPEHVEELAQHAHDLNTIALLSRRVRNPAPLISEARRKIGERLLELDGGSRDTLLDFIDSPALEPPIFSPAELTRLAENLLELNDRRQWP